MQITRSSIKPSFDNLSPINQFIQIFECGNIHYTLNFLDFKSLQSNQQQKMDQAFIKFCEKDSDNLVENLGKLFRKGYVPNDPVAVSLLKVLCEKKSDIRHICEELNLNLEVEEQSSDTSLRTIFSSISNHKKVAHSYCFEEDIRLHVFGQASISQKKRIQTYLMDGDRPTDSLTWIYLLFLVYRDSEYAWMKSELQNYFFDYHAGCIKKIDLKKLDHLVLILNSLFALIFDVMLPEEHLRVLEVGGTSFFACDLMKIFHERIGLYEFMAESRECCDSTSVQLEDYADRFGIILKEEQLVTEIYDLIFGVDLEEIFLDKVYCALKPGGLLVLSSKINRCLLEEKGLVILNDEIFYLTRKGPDS